MAGPHPAAFQSLADDVRRRIDLAEATAREDRLRTHVQLALDVVTVLAGRAHFDEAIERYLSVMSLSGSDAETIRTRALKVLSEQDPEQLAELGEKHRRLSWRYATPVGALRFIRRQLRRGAEEDLWLEMAAARAEETLARMHVGHALGFVALLEGTMDPTRAITLYLERLEVPSLRSKTLYQRALAEVAETQLPRLPAPPAAEDAR